MARFPAILCFLFCSCILYAQHPVSVSSAGQKKLEKTISAINQMDFVEAKKLSAQLIKQYPEWPEAWKVYAEVYQRSGEIRVSESALKQLVKLDSIRYPEAFRYIAEWTFERGEYNQADANFKSYLKLIRDTINLPYRTRILKSSIGFALHQISKPVVIQPIRLGSLINSPADEYFPSVSIDGSELAFTRQMMDPTDTIKKIPRENLYHSVFQDTTYNEPALFPYPINTIGNEGTQSLSQDGRIMFFTACSRPDTKGGCDIYYCVKSGNQWSEPVNLGNPVNSRYWESTPFLASDGKRLFFASSRPGGIGGMDIWMSELKADRSWTSPVNVGAPVNTPLDEMTPYLLVDGKTLFFASNGQVGMGGFDLYKCVLYEKIKTRLPENLGYPVNTNFNEDGLTINAERNIGFFATNRDSLTGKDIFEIDMSRFIPSHAALTISGSVMNRVTKKPIGASIEVEPYGDSVISRVDADPVTGNFVLGIPDRPSYRIGAIAPGYLPYSYYLLNDTLTIKGKIMHNISLEPLITGASIVLNNIFFALDSYELLPESNKDLQEILTIFKQNPSILVEIAGYTDSTGTIDHNLILSRKRAESVVKYLIDHGINANQLRAVGYGSSNPVTSNETEEGRRLNRRTEMKVLNLNN